jgi:hypothetical protein
MQKIIILFLILPMMLTIYSNSELELSNFAYGQEYKGVDKIISGVAAEFYEDNSGFDIEYTLEGVLTRSQVDSDKNSIIFFYDSKGIEEDVLIIKLPEELIDRPRVVYVNDELEPESIVSKREGITTVYVPLFENSTKITFVGNEIISRNGGGCLIATATYGSELSPQVQQLREIRDNQLLQTSIGSSFIQKFNSFYYSFSPAIADFERQNHFFKETVKIAITPMITSLSILNDLDMSSETEVFGYGISLIFLNFAMYLGTPAVIIFGIRKRFNVVTKNQNGQTQKF